ncbi:MAG: thermonuclease family protein [Thermodesulfobacteriota bacterium]|nr:thermonuclease family protein [Thermodesulfobacteriota bacterium]
MKYFRLTILLSLIILLFCSVTHAWTGKVVSVSDGDTIKVLHNGEQVKIRFYGVDTPEKAQSYGKAAKRFTAALAAGKEVGFDPVTKDRYRPYGMRKP